VPTVKLDVVMVTGLPCPVLDPIGDEPSKKLTVEFGGGDETVMATGWPKVDGLGELVRVSGLTTCETVLEQLKAGMSEGMR
jgi:hypothetical protein